MSQGTDLVVGDGNHAQALEIAQELIAGEMQLDFGAGFHLDGSVPADDQVTSLSPIGGNAHHGPVAFTTTHWSVVLEAQGESPAAQEALEKLCRTYWRPIFAFLRRQGIRQSRRRTLPRVFLRSYWSGEV